MKCQCFILIAAIMYLAGCGGSGFLSSRCVHKASGSAGTNGGFEIIKSGYPANWSIYRQPIKDGDVDISFDTEDFVEGTQSLKLVVYQAIPTGGWKTPGLFQRFPAQEKRLYRVSFWMKNQGCILSLIIKSEKNETDAPRHSIKETLAPVQTGTDTWNKYEYTYTVPVASDHIRFEINALRAGIFWIDDVRVEDVGITP